eukprot:jgi/Tetstr1/429429/TSEL_019339.t1
MAVEELTVAPRAGLFRSVRRDGRAVQPYLSAVNNFFKDHGQKSIALGGLVGRVRKGLAASPVIGVMMRKIMFFGGWAMESNVVLDYIDPTMLPRLATWHLWMNPWAVNQPCCHAKWRHDGKTASPLLC